jgi:hypothetical protein
MRVALMFLVLACRPPASVPGPWSPSPGATLREAEASCAAHYCGDVRTPHAWDACRVERCATTAEAWRVDVQRVRAGADGAVAIEANVDFSAGTVATRPVDRTAEAYLGVTVISVQGREYDLAIQTLFPGSFGESVTFLAETDATPADPIRDVIIGLWDRKIEPCDSDRPGCQAFGFLLDGSLAAWPPRTYIDGQRQRIVPEAVTLQVVQSGATLAPAELAARQSAAIAALETALKPFGSKVTAVAPTMTEGQAESSLSAKDAHDGQIVAVASAALGVAVGAASPEADYTLVVAAP